MTKLSKAARCDTYDRAGGSLDVLEDGFPSVREAERRKGDTAVDVACCVCCGLREELRVAVGVVAIAGWTCCDSRNAELLEGTGVRCSLQMMVITGLRGSDGCLAVPRGAGRWIECTS